MRDQSRCLLAAALLFGACPHDGLAQEPVAAMRWATDEGLRHGLQEIRTLVLRHHTLITHRRIAPEIARKFAADVQREADSATTGMLISGAARDARGLLATIETSATVIGRQPGSIEAVDALMRIDGALADYGRWFDHPNWQPLR